MACQVRRAVRLEVRGRPLHWEGCKRVRRSKGFFGPSPVESPGVCLQTSRNKRGPITKWLLMPGRQLRSSCCSLLSNGSPFTLRGGPRFPLPNPKGIPRRDACILNILMEVFSYSETFIQSHNLSDRKRMLSTYVVRCESVGLINHGAT